MGVISPQEPGNQPLFLNPRYTIHLRIFHQEIREYSLHNCKGTPCIWIFILPHCCKNTTLLQEHHTVTRKPNVVFKGTVGLISSNLPCVKCRVWFTTVPFTSLNADDGRICMQWEIFRNLVGFPNFSFWQFDHHFRDKNTQIFTLNLIFNLSKLNFI